MPLKNIIIMCKNDQQIHMCINVWQLDPPRVAKIQVYLTVSQSVSFSSITL